MKHRHLFAVVLALCGFTGAGVACAGAAEQEVDKSPAFTIVGARVFDGEQWLPPGTQVRVQHGLVLAVGPDVGLARGGTIIDATGKVLLPEGLEAAADTQATQADKVRSGHGAIVTGAHADLRLMQGSDKAAAGIESQDWGLGEIIARWKNGVLVGHHSGSKTL